MQCESDILFCSDIATVTKEGGFLRRVNLMYS